MENTRDSLHCYVWSGLAGFWFYICNYSFISTQKIAKLPGWWIPLTFVDWIVRSWKRTNCRIWNRNPGIRQWWRIVRARMSKSRPVLARGRSFYPSNMNPRFHQHLHSPHLCASLNESLLLWKWVPIWMNGNERDKAMIMYADLLMVDEMRWILCSEYEDEWMEELNNERTASHHDLEQQ